MQLFSEIKFDTQSKLLDLWTFGAHAPLLEQEIKLVLTLHLA